METIAGVDGSKGGWLVAITAEWPSVKPTFTLCPTFKHVIDITSERSVIDATCKCVICTTSECCVAVVDMPIGLPNGSSERLCDPQARVALADKRIPSPQARVFKEPLRSALHVFDAGNGLTRPQQWTEFQKTIKDLSGKNPTRQTFDFSAKVKEVDDAMNPELQQRIVEFHPEPAWKRMAGKVLQSKHKASGLLQRLKLLQEIGASWITDLEGDPILADVALDDLFDAVIGLAVAHDISRHSTPSERANELKKDLYLNRFPKGKPEIDEEKQLRMEIWY